MGLGVTKWKTKDFWTIADYLYVWADERGFWSFRATPQLLLRATTRYIGAHFSMRTKPGLAAATRF